ncbi:MAG: hypothetical protein R2723_02270 [Microbacterium sp.]
MPGRRPPATREHAGGARREVADDGGDDGRPRRVDRARRGPRTGSETGDAEPGGDAAAPSLVRRFLTRYLVEVDGPILQPRTAAGSELSPDLVTASADLEIALTTLVEADQAAPKALPAEHHPPPT